VSLAFVLAGDVLYPGASIATGQSVLVAADAVLPAAANDLRQALTSLPVLPGIAAAGRAVAQFSGLALSAVNDASRAFNAVRGVVGVFGRYASGSRSISQGFTTVRGALSAAITTRNAVVSAANSLVRLGGLF
jgi:hypothetical protein